MSQLQTNETLTKLYKIIPYDVLWVCKRAIFHKCLFIFNYKRKVEELYACMHRYIVSNTMISTGNSCH